MVHRIKCLCVFVCLLICADEIQTLKSTPNTFYIASLTDRDDNTFQKSLLSAIEYINRESHILPGKNLSLISYNSTFLKANLLKYVELLSQNDVIALMADCRPSASQRVLTNMLRIPLLSMHQSHGNDFNKYSVALGASGYDVGQAMLDVIKEQRWIDLIVMYDIRFRDEAKHFVDNLPENTSYSKLVLELQNNGNLCDATKSHLKNLQNSPVDAIVLFSDSRIAGPVVDEVHCTCLNTIEKPHAWLISDMITSLSMNAQQSQTVVGFMPTIYPNQYTKYFGNDIRKDSKSLYNSSFFAYDAALLTAGALQNVINKGLWVHRNATSDIEASKNGPLIFQEMNQTSIVSTTGPIQLGQDSARRNMKLDILNLQHGKFAKVGRWNSVDRLKLETPILQNQPTAEFVPLDKLNRRLKVVVVIDPPFVMLSKKGKLEGFSIDLIQRIAAKLQFKYEIYLSPDGLYGGKNADGSYNGIVGQLTKKLADMSTSPLTINSQRMPILDFSKPFMQYTMSLITKKLDYNSQDLMAFMLPYSSTVWFLTLASLIIVTGLMYAVNYISPYGYKQSKKSQNREAFNLVNSLWFCLASMLQQGADNTPRSLSGRVLGGCFWFFILIWISTYTANLAAFFTVRNASKAVSTLEEVVEGDLPFYIVRDTALHHFLQAASYKTYRKLYQRIAAHQTFVNSTTAGYGVARRIKNAVFMAEKPSTEYVIMQEPCDLTAASGLLGASSYGIAMPKYYPYVRNISVAVLQLHENGELDSLWRKWWDNRSQCPKEQTRSAIGTGKQIELHNMIGVYMVLATGGISSIILVLGELFWYKHGRYFKTLFRNEFVSLGLANHQSSQSDTLANHSTLRVESRTTVL